MHSVATVAFWQEFKFVSLNLNSDTKSKESAYSFYLAKLLKPKKLILFQILLTFKVQTVLFRT